MKLSTPRIFANITAVAMLLGLTGQASAADAAQRSAGVERGRYLVTISGCNDCHTAGYLEQGGATPESQWLTGSPVGYQGPWGTTYAANLRLVAGRMTEAEWVAHARKERLPPMPWFNVKAMSDTDLKAVYAFIRSLGNRASRLRPTWRRAARSRHRTLCSCPRSTRSRPHAEARAACRRVSEEFGQRDGSQDVEPEASATRLLDAQGRASLLEPAFEQDQPCFEVLADVGQADGRVESQFAVAVVIAPVLGVTAQEPPEDAAGDALDQVIVVDEDAVVLGVAPDAQAAYPRSSRPCGPDAPPGRS